MPPRSPSETVAPTTQQQQQPDPAAAEAPALYDGALCVRVFAAAGRPARPPAARAFCVLQPFRTPENPRRPSPSNETNKVLIHIERGERLLARDAYGGSDPYVVVNVVTPDGARLTYKCGALKRG
jgi:hypothetical protein